MLFCHFLGWQKINLEFFLIIVHWPRIHHVLRCFTAWLKMQKGKTPPPWLGRWGGGCHRRHKKKGSRYYPRIQQVGIIREYLDEEFLQVQEILLEVPQDGICTKSDFLSQEENELVFQNLK